MIIYLITFTVLNILITLLFLKFSRDITNAIQIEFIKQKSNQQRQIDMLTMEIRNLKKGRK